jgi:hypothetical protein
MRTKLTMDASDGADRRKLVGKANAECGLAKW